MQLLNYSASTAVRATLLAVGFTVAHNDATLAQKQGVSLLGEEWLNRWERSDAKVARTLSKSDELEFEEKIRQHPQFR